MSRHTPLASQVIREAVIAAESYAEVLHRQLGELIRLLSLTPAQLREEEARRKTLGTSRTLEALSAPRLRTGTGRKAASRRSRGAP